MNKKMGNFSLQIYISLYMSVYNLFDHIYYYTVLHGIMSFIYSEIEYFIFNLFLVLSNIMFHKIAM